ncbi:MAG TPA: EpsG family protein [Clostridia bacterium]|nr:EpsG family protein [Clostridia bacterium]
MKPIWTLAISTLFLFWYADRYDSSVSIRIGRIRISRQFIYWSAVAAIILVSGLRSNVGDTAIYMINFTRIIPWDFSTLRRSEPGFELFQLLIKSLIHPHSQALIIITSLITMLALFYAIYRWSPSYFISGFLFFTTSYYMTIINGVNQGMVAALHMLLIPLILKRKFLIYSLIVLALSTLHSSALILIPIFIAVSSRRWRFFSLMLAILALVIIFFPAVFTAFIPFLERTQYAVYASIDLSGIEGANPLRTAVSFIPVFLGVLYRKRSSKNIAFYDLCLKMAILNSLFLVMGHANWIFVRMNFYFMPFVLLLLPMVFMEGMKPRERAVIMGVMIVLYSVLFWYEYKNVIFVSKFLNINGHHPTYMEQIIYK